jgi:hypothetical protein
MAKRLAWISSMGCLFLFLGFQPASAIMDAAVAVTTGNTTVSEVEGTTLNADDYMSTTETAEDLYAANNSWQDFEVHFFTALPFTALYSYATVMFLDGMIQGQFPPTFRTVDTWIVIGLAVGAAVAIALGSYDRVPNQSEKQWKIDSPQGQIPLREQTAEEVEKDLKATASEPVVK